MAGKLERLVIPPRKTVLPLPAMSQATPMRGLKSSFQGASPWIHTNVLR